MMENFVYPDVRRDDFNALWDNGCLFYRFHYDEAMPWSKTMKPESSFSQDLPCRRKAEGI